MLLEELNVDKPSSAASPKEPVSSEYPTLPVEEPAQLETPDLLGKSIPPEETSAVSSAEAEDVTDKSNLFHPFCLALFHPKLGHSNIR